MNHISFVEVKVLGAADSPAIPLNSFSRFKFATDLSKELHLSGTIYVADQIYAKTAVSNLSFEQIAKYVRDVEWFIQGPAMSQEPAMLEDGLARSESYLLPIVHKEAISTRVVTGPASIKLENTESLGKVMRDSLEPLGFKLKEGPAVLLVSADLVN